MLPHGNVSMSSLQTSHKAGFNFQEFGRKQVEVSRKKNECNFLVRQGKIFRAHDMKTWSRGTSNKKKKKMMSSFVKYQTRQMLLSWNHFQVLLITITDSCRIYRQSPSHSRSSLNFHITTKLKYLKQVDFHFRHHFVQCIFNHMGYIPLRFAKTPLGAL